MDTFHAAGIYVLFENGPGTGVRLLTRLYADCPKDAQEELGVYQTGDFDLTST